MNKEFRQQIWQTCEVDYMVDIQTVDGSGVGGKVVDVGPDGKWIEILLSNGSVMLFNSDHIVSFTKRVA